MITHMRVRPENASAFEALMTDVCSRVREHEPGVSWYTFARNVDVPDTYVVVEVYRDAAAHAAHMASAWVRESLPLSARLIEGKFEIRQYVSSGTEPVRLRHGCGS